MRPTRKSAWTIAAACAVGAALLFFYALRGKPPAPTPKPTTTVVVAVSKIRASELISRDMVKVVVMDLAAAPEGAATDIDKVVDRPALTEIQPGAAVLANQVPTTNAGGLSVKIPPGMRAVTVAIDPVSGVAGFLQYSDRVDVLATFTIGEEAVTKTVLQDVQLLAIGERASLADTPQPTSGQPGAPSSAPAPPKPTASTTATLAVLPSQAQALVLAASKGTIRLALRSPQDHALVSLAPTQSPALIGVKMPAAQPPPAEVQPPAQAAAAYPMPPAAGLQPQVKPVKTIEVIKGDQREMVTP